MSKYENYNLQERLIKFAARIIKVAESLPETKTGNHIRGQLLRSDTSPAPNYGEAQSAESRADFIHKIKIVLKELRETHVWLLLILEIQLIEPADLLVPVKVEANELISIFVKSVETTRKNMGSTS